jgi:hypothetical protein
VLQAALRELAPTRRDDEVKFGAGARIQLPSTAQGADSTTASTMYVSNIVFSKLRDSLPPYYCFLVDFFVYFNTTALAPMEG